MTRLWLLIVVLIAASFASVNLMFAVRHANAQVAAPGAAQQRAQTHQGAIDEAPLPSDAEERAKREAKNRRYNRGQRDLTTMGPDVALGVIGEPPMMPLLPVAYAQVIVIGTVVSAQPYLSEDHSFVYTEYAMQVEDFLKKGTGVLPTANDRLIVDREGGVIRLRSGQVIRYDFGDRNMARPLHIGERCVLFLRRIHDGVDLIPGPGFLLHKGQAYVLSGQVGQEMLVGERRDVPKEFSQEEAFLKAVRRAIENPPSPRFYSALDIKAVRKER